MIQNATPYTGDPVTLPLHQISVAAQIRTRNGFDHESLAELAGTIRQHGLLQPLVVHRTGDDTYQLIAGERRLLACELAGLAEVPVLVRAIGNEDEAKALQAVENLQRVELSLFDRAEGVAALVAKLGAKRAASMLGKSPAWVSKHLMAAKLPEVVRLAAQEGQCEDLEVLQCVKAIGNHSREAFDHALSKLAEGTLGRGEARAVLDELNKPATVDHAGGEGDGDGEGGGEGDDSGDQAQKLARLELGLYPAQLIMLGLRSLAKTGSNEKTRRDAEMVCSYVDEFIAKNWPK